MNLYEITQEQLKLNAMLEESGGELTPEIEQALQIQEGELQSKTESYCKAISMYNNKIEEIDNEIKRLKTKKTIAENAVERMKTALFNAMNVFETAKIEAGTFTVSLRKSTHVEVTDLELVPRSFIKEVTTKSVDKAAVKEALKNNVEVSGVILVENQNVQIR